MKEYKSLEQLHKDWDTNKDLFRILEDHGFTHENRAILRWEKQGIIPHAKRVKVCGTLWRVYQKDGSDYIEILKCLDKVSHVRRVYMRP